MAGENLRFISNYTFLSAHLLCIDSQERVGFLRTGIDGSGKRIIEINKTIKTSKTSKYTTKSNMKNIKPVICRMGYAVASSQRMSELQNDSRLESLLFSRVT